MKQTGKCSKCGNTDIRGPYRIGGQYSTQIKMPGLRSATFNCFTCPNCGYSELYSDQKGLNNIINDNRKYIPGKEYVKPARDCPKCAISLTKEDNYCPECGYNFKIIF